MSVVLKGNSERCLDVSVNANTRIKAVPKQWDILWKPLCFKAYLDVWTFSTNFNNGDKLMLRNQINKTIDTFKTFEKNVIIEDHFWWGITKMSKITHRCIEPGPHDSHIVTWTCPVITSNICFRKRASNCFLNVNLNFSHCNYRSVNTTSGICSCACSTFVMQMYTTQGVETVGLHSRFWRFRGKFRVTCDSVY